MEARFLAADLLQGNAEEDHGPKGGLILAKVPVGAILLAELGAKPGVAVIGLEAITRMALVIAHAGPAKSIGRRTHVLGLGRVEGTAVVRADPVFEGGEQVHLDRVAEEPGLVLDRICGGVSRTRSARSHHPQEEETRAASERLRERQADLVADRPEIIAATPGSKATLH
jgi:hypothetical protein